MQILVEIYQNRTAGKDDFFRKSSVAQIKTCETNESQITTWGMRTKFSRQSDVLAERINIFGGSTEIYFRTATSPNHNSIATINSLVPQLCHKANHKIQSIQGRFFPFLIFSYHSSLLKLENFLHTKLLTIFISNISVIKIINPLGSFSTQV